MLRQRLKKLLIAAGVVASVGAMSGTASAVPVLPDFTIDQTNFSNCETFSQAGSAKCLVTADLLNGGYTEVFTVLTEPDAGNGFVGTFSTLAYWDLGQMFGNDGQTAISNAILNNESTADGYAIYALFASTGTFTPASAGQFDFTGLVGCVDVYVDYNVDGRADPPAQAKHLPADAPLVAPCAAAPPAAHPIGVTVDNDSEDRLLASALLQSGEGHQFNSTDKGSFTLIFDPFQLTTLGSEYFVAPNPFYLTAILAGNFNNFGAGGPNGSTTITGAADAWFASPIPEPGTLVLFGLGLIGVARQYSRKVKAVKA